MLFFTNFHQNIKSAQFDHEVVVPQFEPDNWSASRRGDQEEMEKKIEEVDE